MKIAVLIILMSSINSTFACSEMGKIEFNLSKITQNSCGKIAQTYALKFTKSIVEQEKN